MGYIYKVTNIKNKKVYIGLTTRTVHRRKIEHFNQAGKPTRSCAYFHAALLKYGATNFIWETVYESNDIQKLEAKEIELITYYNSYGDGGYNLCIGGNSNAGYKHSKETVELRKRFRHSEETKQKMSKRMQGNKLSKETKQKIAAANLGKKASSETRKKLSNSQKNKGTKKVICNETREIFPSITAAAKSLNVAISCISGVLTGKQKTTKGLTFNYYKDTDETSDTLQTDKNGKDSAI